MARSLAFALLLLTLSPAMALAQPAFSGDDHCVAYWTSKRVMLVRTVGVIGRNCEVNARVLRRDDGTVSIEVVVPAHGFDSGNGRRDRDVERILDAARHPRIRFTAGPLAPGVVRRLEAGERLAVPGFLEVAGERHAIEFAVRLSEGVVTGEARSTFAALGLEIGRVGPGGMVADPGEEVALMLHLQRDRVVDADRISAESPP